MFTLWTKYSDSTYITCITMISLTTNIKFAKLKDNYHWLFKLLTTKANNTNLNAIGCDICGWFDIIEICVISVFSLVHTISVILLTVTLIIFLNSCKIIIFVRSIFRMKSMKNHHDYQIPFPPTQFRTLILHN